MATGRQCRWHLRGRCKGHTKECPCTNPGLRAGQHARTQKQSQSSQGRITCSAFLAAGFDARLCLGLRAGQHARMQAQSYMFTVLVLGPWAAGSDARRLQENQIFLRMVHTVRDMRPSPDARQRLTLALQIGSNLTDCVRAVRRHEHNVSSRAGKPGCKNCRPSLPQIRDLPCQGFLHQRSELLGGGPVFYQACCGVGRASRLSLACQHVRAVLCFVS